VLHNHKELTTYLDKIKRTAEVEKIIEKLLPGVVTKPNTIRAREPEIKPKVTQSITSNVNHIPIIKTETKYPTAINGNQSKQIDAPTIIVLDSSNESKLEAALHHLLLCSELAVDCEGVNMSETGILCLVQIAAPAKVPGNISNTPIDVN
jgi:hypothetical protein